MSRWICKRSWWVWLGLNGVLAAAVGILLWSGAEAQQGMPQSLPTVGFSASAYTVGEGDGSVTLTVVLSHASTETVTVDFATSDGTATGDARGGADGGDYTVTAVSLTFSPGETSKTIVISIYDDPCTEGNETFTVTLSSPSGASLGSPATATVTILSDD